MNSLHIDYTDTVKDNLARRTIIVRDDLSTISFEIYHEFSDEYVDINNLPIDGSVLAILLFALAKGLPLRLHGPFTQNMARNVEELSLLWNRWNPSIYNKIDIYYDKLVDMPGRVGPARAIAAFSGGVDSIFTAMRHTRLLPEYLRYPLKDVLLVHGFDIDLERPDYLSRLIERERPLLNDLGLNLHVMRTTSKNWSRQDWVMSHGLELAACLHMYSGQFQYGLLGSSKPYDEMDVPFGSSPVSDHLFSGGLMQIIHDGAGFSRTDKVAQIARFPIACQTLKVCWAGPDQSNNCGRCEKCIRTMMNFLACQQPIPPAFTAAFSKRDIAKIKIYNRTQAAEFVSIIEYARKRGVQAFWVQAIQRRLAHGYSRYSSPWVIQMIGRALHYVGLKEPIKFLLYRGAV